MVTKSKFKPTALLVVFLLGIVTWLLSLMISSVASNSNPPLIAVIIFFAVFGFTWLWLVLIELRKNYVKVTLLERSVNCSRFAGLGREKSYKLADFDTLEIKNLRTRYGKYEFLFFIRNGKTSFTLSEYYHANYEELKSILALSL